MSTNLTGYWCDPLTGPHGCDPSNYNSYKIFYSVAFFGLTSALLALIAKAMKRLYHQGLSWHSFSVPLNIAFVVAGCLRFFHCVVQMAQFKQDDELWANYGYNSTLVAEYYDEKEWLNRGLVIWLSSAPIAIILSGFFVLVVFWIDMWRVSQNFGRSMGFSTYFLYSTPLSLIVIGVSLAPVLLAVCSDYDVDRYIIGFRVELVFSFFFILIFCCYFVLYISFKKQQGEATTVVKAVVTRLENLLIRLGLGCTFFCTGSLFAVGFWPVIISEDQRQEWWIVIVGIQFVGEFFFLDVATSSIRDGEMTQSGLGRALAKKTRVSIRSNGGDKSIRAEDISANSHNTGKTVGGKVKCEPSWVSFSKEELEFAEELPLWVKFPDSLSQFFSFPHPIDMINVRIKGFLMFLLIALSLLLDATIDVPWVYIYVTVAYLCRALCGPRLDPPSWLTFYIIRPVVDFFFKAKPSYTAGPPKRFAQLCGFTMALVYCLVRMAGGYKEIANYIAGFHLMLIVLEVYFEICGGCAMFAGLMLCKVIPQDTCEQCKILFANDDDEKDFFSGSKSRISKTTDVSV